jgi:hypothetical protein
MRQAIINTTPAMVKGTGNDLLTTSRTEARASTQ